MNTPGRNLRDVRRAAGLTQQELAVRLRVAQSVISRIESGQHRMSVELLVRAARALDCDPVRLLEAERQRA